jgi:L-alanine-DL-glutamate epimerase-like enolase superfamily enzyme
MIVASLESGALVIPFKLAFNHASASRAATQTLMVVARSEDGVSGFGEGCPREYVTAETLATTTRFILAHRSDWLSDLHDVHDLFAWSNGNRVEIDARPAAWTAVELALLDLCGRVDGRPAEALLGLPPLAGNFRYTAVLGDMSLSHFETQLAQYLRMEFCEFKIKLTGDRARDRARVQALLRAGVPPDAVRADANNLWNDADTAIGDLAALDYPFFAVEEPLRTGDYNGMRRLARALDTNIVLDESMLRVDQLHHLDGTDVHWIANVRVSKMGGLVRSLEFIEAARRRGLSIIVGAHVGETSLLTRAAMTVAMRASDILLGQEGAFGTHLLSSDIVDHPVMFGRGGVLDAASLAIGSLPGLGLSVVQPLPYFDSLGTALP